MLNGVKVVEASRDFTVSGVFQRAPQSHTKTRREAGTSTAGRFRGQWDSCGPGVRGPVMLAC